jgi:hypothetical protein
MTYEEAKAKYPNAAECQLVAMDGKTPVGPLQLVEPARSPAEEAEVVWEEGRDDQ